MYKIVFFDIDGTLLNTRRELPESVVESVEKLRQNGILTAIATGRTPFNIEDVIRTLRIDTYVVYNGGLLVYQGEIMEQTEIDQGTLSSIVRRIQAHHHSLIVNEVDEFSVYTDDLEYVLGSLGKHWNREGMKRFDGIHGPVSQIELYCPFEEIHEYIDAYPNLTFHPWSTGASIFNVIPKGVSKAGGIETIIQRLGIDRSEVVAFGDGPNDLEMISFAGMGVAMGNAVDELKAVAKLTTRDADDDGIQYALQQLGLID
ncbi:Cof-type HAD-IIB family hydrolase [Alicyclobacillus fastidiosus]|uniref:Cof-type HAD-IIB family hydrolase n=1 Tax=Alicyclobacillus fastidiosus TaxID=392011 RepID=A0ABV5AI75_9BACL|nr:Cof-type HAD-IIB family hydrolase [Alicyclobacillus fastidiosus]WEH10164.1 Cof-type HAD-IIB family hydrolase [Alicyclobacillus fastidiosus]